MHMHKIGFRVYFANNKIFASKNLNENNSINICCCFVANAELKSLRSTNRTNARYEITNILHLQKLCLYIFPFWCMPQMSVERSIQ